MLDVRQEKEGIVTMIFNGDLASSLGNNSYVFTLVQPMNIRAWRTESFNFNVQASVPQYPFFIQCNELITLQGSKNRLFAASGTSFPISQPVGVSLPNTNITTITTGCTMLAFNYWTPCHMDNLIMLTFNIINPQTGANDGTHQWTLVMSFIVPLQ